jgi:hypothetical protein
MTLGGWLLHVPHAGRQEKIKRKCRVIYIVRIEPVMIFAIYLLQIRCAQNRGFLII